MCIVVDDDDDDDDVDDDDDDDDVCVITKYSYTHSDSLFEVWSICLMSCQSLC